MYYYNTTGKKNITTDTYNITTTILWLYYSNLQVYRPTIPTDHYRSLQVTTVTTGHYRFREKVTEFADAERPKNAERRIDHSTDDFISRISDRIDVLLETATKATICWR